MLPRYVNTNVSEVDSSMPAAKFGQGRSMAYSEIKRNIKKARTLTDRFYTYSYNSILQTVGVRVVFVYKIIDSSIRSAYSRS